MKEQKFYGPLLVVDYSKITTRVFKRSSDKTHCEQRRLACNEFVKQLKIYT